MTRTREENAADLQREEEEALSVEFLPIQDGAITTSRPYRVQLQILTEVVVMASSKGEALIEAEAVCGSLEVVDHHNDDTLDVLLVTKSI